MIKTTRVSKDQPAGTVIGVQKGPVQARNWFSTTIDPAYSVVQSGGTGVVALEGTNDVALRNANGDYTNWTSDLLPTENAVWTEIAANSASFSGTFNTEYQFLRLRIKTQGTGTVNSAWVRWN